MNPRQLHALTHPLSTPDPRHVAELRSITAVGRTLHVVVLAVDR